jgi:hypothetical protein
MRFSDHVDATDPPAVRRQANWIFKSLLQRSLPEADEELPAETSLLMWAGDLLQKIALQSDQIQLALTAIRPNIAAAVIPGSTYQLAILDGRYMVYSEADTILDLESGDTLEKMPHTPLESVAYNLGELYRRRTQGARHAEADPGSLVQP